MRRLLPSPAPGERRHGGPRASPRSRASACDPHGVQTPVSTAMAGLPARQEPSWYGSVPAMSPDLVVPCLDSQSGEAAPTTLFSTDGLPGFFPDRFSRRSTSSPTAGAGVSRRRLEKQRANHLFLLTESPSIGYPPNSQ